MNAINDSVGTLAGSLTSPNSGGLVPNTNVSTLDAQNIPSGASAPIVGAAASALSTLPSSFTGWLGTQTKNLGAWLAVFLIGLLLVAMGIHLVTQD